jgi:hypothetical protein
VDSLPVPLWKTLTATLATRFEKPVSIIRKLIPKETRILYYRRARQLEGGDTVHARELIPLKSDSRDMSFVRVSSPLMMALMFVGSLPPYSISSLSTNSPISHVGCQSLSYGISLDKSSFSLLLISLPPQNMGFSPTLLLMQSSSARKFQNQPPIVA